MFNHDNIPDKDAEPAVKRVSLRTLASVKETTALSPFEAPQGSSAHSTPLGRWVFDHKKDFSPSNPLAWYGIRNVANNMVAILGLMATIVPVRMGMGHIARWADGKGMRKTQQFFSNNVLQNSIGVGISFATFRAMYKVWQRAYDDIFMKPQDADQAAQALKAAPKKAVDNYLQIAAAEYPATMVAAFALVGIRQAITPHKPEAKENHWKDVAACALLAYPAFFEITERLGRSFQLGMGYKTRDKNEHIDKDKETLGEFLTRQLPGVAAGIVPYIHVNNLWYRKSGRQFSYKDVTLAVGNKKIDNYFTSFWKERPYEAFFLFTLGRDVYFDIYDKLTGRSATQTKSGLKPYERMAHPARVDDTPDVSDTMAGGSMPWGPSSNVGAVQHAGMALEDRFGPERATA